MSRKDKENRKANSALSFFLNRKQVFMKERGAYILTHACV